MSLGERILGYHGPDYGCFSSSDLTYDVYEVAGINVHVEVVDNLCLSIYYVRVSE